ncbi:MAG: SpoIID/LytB domain-containing protein [Ruminococcaceae bacterium]|nr:SpoIID/LytB domain-containing protein [Oscillospiraceae bacterium]
MVRLICLILAVLMCAGAAYTIIATLILDVKADTTTTYTSNSRAIDTSSLKNSGDVLISVGLMYGSNITTSFQITTDGSGYQIGKQQLGGSRGFTQIWDLYDQTLSVMADVNVAKNGYTYTPTNDYYSTKIGAYHVQVDCDDLGRWEFAELIENTKWQIETLGLYQIPAYIYTGYAIRIGDFATWDDASVYLDHVKQIYPDRYVSVVTPEQTAVSVVNTYTDKVVFEYDCGAQSEIGFKAHENSDGNTYIKTPAGNVYDGVFAFKRHYNGSVDGVALINILPLESYVAGVIPYEMEGTWPIEVLKEFAVTVRSFSLTHGNKHSDYYFDLCNTTCCQLYKGAGRVNDNVMEAIMSTEGQVIAYKGDIITAYYSSTMGGVTVSPHDAWGGSSEIPYLAAKETPWEDYAGHSNGFWITEISPESLLERLQKAGHTSLKGAIDDIEILEYAKNSTYVKAIKFTDIYGNSVTIRNTDKVRTSLTPYVNSANFVVGKGSVEYTIETPYDSLAESGSEDDDVGDVYYPGADDEDFDDEDYEYDISYGYTDIDTYYVITSDSMEKAYRDEKVSVMTGDGLTKHDKSDVFVMCRQTAAAFLGDDYLIYLDKEDNKNEDKFDTEIVEDKSDEYVTYKIAHAENERNFIFVGKGWGHGVGISQWGSYDLAVMGYGYEDILLAYFTGAEILDYRDTNNYN